MPFSVPGPVSSALDYINPVREARTGNGPSIATYQNVQTTQPSKVFFISFCQFYSFLLSLL